MIGRILGLPAGAVSMGAIQSLVDSSRAEDQTLEFKREPPGKSDSDKTSFRTDVAAMANGGGGLIVYGIAEGAEGRAAAIVPFSLAAQAERLHQLVNTGIEPYLPVQILEVPDARDAGVGCLVLVVDGPARPYGVQVNDRWTYPRRTGRTTDYLSESQIAQMYRDRFRRDADIRERFEDLQVLCTRSELSPLLPQLSVLGTPAEPVARLFKPDGATKARIRAIPSPTMLTPSDTGSPIFPQLRSGFRRIDLAPDFQAAVLNKYGWAGFHDDGSYHRVVRGMLVKSNIAEMNDVPGFYDTRLAISLAAALHGYGLLLQEFGVDDEVLVQVRLADTALPAPLVPSANGAHSYEVTAARHPFLTEVAAEAHAIASRLGALQTAKPLLDDVFSAFTWEGCSLLADDGRPVLSRWPAAWRADVRHWCDTAGISL